MCWIITIAVMPDAVPLAQAWQRGRTGLNVLRTQRPEDVQAFPPGLAVLDVLKGGCSCALMPALPVRRMEITADQDKLRDRYRRLGWSAAKTERAVQARIHDSEKKPPPDHSDHLRLRAALAQLAECAGPVYVLAQWLGREAQECSPAAVTLTPQAFLEQGFAPQTLVVIRPGFTRTQGTNTWTRPTG
ncbi:hypothetical protein [Hydrogenophaga sp.]|uniref:hypothetical protein n=1 Tax=Hydrogenophaga sp. TaxID=1904254 RepID=UPI0019845AE5|nr:hypothetical protein [Hydrogenophaga sp.]MBD3893953.1 hypothetical protein [Hydrogenophaga sp.]